MTRVDYRFRIYNAGATGLSTANVDFTLDGSRLAAPIHVRAPTVLPGRGRSEAQPWDVMIADMGSTFTSQLADSSGRLNLLGRIGLAQTNRDGAGWTNLGAGRLTDIYLDDSVAAYRVVVEDERTLEGTALIFNTTNTTRLFPGGPHTQYGGWGGPNKGNVEVSGRGTEAGTTNMWRVTFFRAFPPISNAAREAIKNDLISNPALTTKGNFTHARLRIGNTDYPIVGALDVSSTNPSGWSRPSENFTGSIDSWGDQLVRVWVAASSNQLTAVTEYSSAFLHMFTAPPSAATPLHIGGGGGQHPMQILKNILDGTYSSTETPKVRYSTAALSTGSTGLMGQPMPLVRFRITGPAVLREWVEDYLYAPFMVAPTIARDGTIVPVSLKLPNSTAAIATTLTGANLRDPHPSWSHPRRDAVTVLNVEYEHEQFSADGAADHIEGVPKTFEVLHDRVSMLGRKTLTLKAHGLHTGAGSPNQVDGQQVTNTVDFKRYVAFIQRDFFDRFGDGPIMGTLHGMESGSSAITPGKFVKVNLETYPNPANAARGGTRIVQVLGRGDTPLGPEFPYLDAGPNLQQVTNPTIALTTSAADPHHSVVATIGTVPAGGSFNLELAHSSALPAASNQLWQSWETTGRTSGAYRIGRRPSNTKVWARVQATKPNRIRSDWVNSTGKTTLKITGPTGFAGSSISAGTVLGTWSIGDPAYDVSVHADTSTSAALSTANRITMMAAGSKRYRFEGLDSTTKYLLGVRHVDPYGGVSTGSYAAVTTTVATRTSPSMLGISVLRGGP